MATTDKLLGSVMVLVAAFVFIYYSVWALLLPFVSDQSTLRAFFPPREWTVRLPALLLLIALTGVGLFFATVTLSEARKKRRSGKKV